MDRWRVSDLVCTAFATKPVQTGIIRTIEGSERDQLAAEVKFETCFKGELPVSSTAQGIGYSVWASKDIHGGTIYSGPPPGFVHKGRNLLFLRHTSNPNIFEVAVPIYETAIRLADTRPYYRSDTSARSVRFALTRELEAALVQFDVNDVSDIDRLFDMLGPSEAVTELSSFIHGVPMPVQRDIAVALLTHDQVAFEPLAISLLIDTSALVWKRENAASALGEHGTELGLAYLRQVAAEPAEADELKQLHQWTVKATQRLEERLCQRASRK